MSRGCPSFHTKIESGTRGGVQAEIVCGTWYVVRGTYKSEVVAYKWLSYDKLLNSRIEDCKSVLLNKFFPSAAALE
eukprot:scaffold92513_cov42-Cyclotella_meneghiniana.AAC.2